MGFIKKKFPPEKSPTPRCWSAGQTRGSLGPQLCLLTQEAMCPPSWSSH